MEGAVRLHAGLSAGDLLRLLREDCLHPPDLSVRGSRCSQRGDLGLDDLSRLECVPQGVLFREGQRRPRVERDVDV